MQTNARDDVLHSQHDLHVHALERNVGDSDDLCDRCILDSSGDANRYAPNTSGVQCSDMDATILANSPNRMANAMLPMMDPKTNRKS